MFIGYFLAILIGITLGLLGGGGSILAVPVLVYVMDINPLLATTYSLGIVGTTAFFGASQHIRNRNVDIRAALIFGIPDSIALFVTRRFLVPALPETILSIGSYTVSKADMVLLLLAVFMAAAAVGMIRPRNIESAKTTTQKKQTHAVVQLIATGLFVGTITGIVGAGGGFLIVPALVLLHGTPIKKAVGTSLVIIAWKSLIGFGGDIAANVSIDWQLLIVFTVLSISGSFLGVYISQFVPAKKLKPAFGWFVVIAALYIFTRNLFL